MTDAKSRVLKQWSSVGDAYVTSAGFATANDLQRMVELAKPESDDVLLDVATGGGHVARTFAPHVRTVILSDLVPEMLIHAEKHVQDSGISNYEMLVADAEQLPLEDVSIDIVTCRIAPHHFPDPGQFVSEVFRVLVAGGRFVLIDSTVTEGKAGDAFNAIEKLRDPSHEQALTIEEWQHLLRDAGFELRHQESFPKRHDFQDWTARSRMSETDRETLEKMLLAPELRVPHAVELDASNRVVAFSDTKTLFFSVKSAVH